LAACGVLEAIAITRSGYPDRLLCCELAPQFAILIHPEPVPTNLREDDAAACALCDRLFQAAGLVRIRHFELGHRKAFFRTGAFALLREARRKRTLVYATVLQAAARRMLAVRYTQSLVRVVRAAAADKQDQARKNLDAATRAERSAAEAVSAAVDEVPLGEDADAAAEVAALDAKRDELDRLRNPNSELSAARAKLRKVKGLVPEPETAGTSAAVPRVAHSRTAASLETRSRPPQHVIRADDQDIANEGDEEMGDGVALPKAGAAANPFAPVAKREVNPAELDPGTLDYARYLGMDPNDPTDAGLLWIAKDALHALVPEPWLESVDMRGRLYYVNEMVFQHRGQWGKTYWTPGSEVSAQHTDAQNRKRTEFDYYTQSGYYQSTAEMAEAFDFDDLPAVPRGSEAAGPRPLPPNLQQNLVVDLQQPACSLREREKQSVDMADLPVPLSPFGELPLLRVLTEPAGRFAMVQCYVQREHGRSGLRYDLYLELPPYHALYCMSARKVKAARTSLFRIATNKSSFDVRAPGYLGKLKASDMGGLSWTLYGPGVSPRKADRGGGRNARKSSASAASKAESNDKDDDDDEGDELRAETLTVLFEKSILGSGGPTQLTAALPAESDEGHRHVVCPRSKEETLGARLEAGRRTGLVTMTNK
ncbi:hypothetical protein T492DRAFT_890520, partial [Pavlovales sp. CCMP2436]